jgi:hypothetical protein
MTALKKSPRITQISWDQVEIEGNHKFKDVKLYPGGCREWNWNETGTQHTSGIQPADVTELLEHGSQEVVLSRGVLGRLKIHADTLSMLEDRKIRVHVRRTKEAVRLYNELCKTLPVGALIHSTC